MGTAHLRIPASGTGGPCPPSKILASVQDLQLRHLWRLDVLNADLRGELLDDPEQIRPRGGTWREGLLQQPFVATFADVDIQRHFPEEGNAELFGLALRSATAEEVSALVAGVGE